MLEQISFEEQLNLLVHQIILTGVSYNYKSEFIGHACMMLAPPLLSVGFTREEIVGALRSVIDELQDDDKWAEVEQKGILLNNIGRQFAERMTTQISERRN